MRPLVFSLSISACYSQQTLYLATPGWLAEPQSKKGQETGVERMDSTRSTTNTPPKFCIAPDGSKTTFLWGRWEGKFSRSVSHWGVYTRYIPTIRKNTLPSPRPWQGRSSAKIGLISNCIVSWMAKTNKWLMFMILHKPRTCCSMSDVFHRIGWNEVRAWRTTLNTYTIHVHLEKFTNRETTETWVTYPN